jgi:2'-5' RNA ligase
MQLTGQTLPGYRAYEYLLVLNPHEELRKKIVQVKKEFSESYGIGNAGGLPQVSLVNFIQYEMMEERLINRLKVVAMSFPPFKVELKDFGSFPSHTIYINVTSKLPVQNLVREIRSQSQRLMKLNDENKPHFILEPHINVARKLKPAQYEKGWPEYSQKNFTGRFIADGMSLVKRPAGEIRYNLVTRFDFQNMPVSTKQGELFG